MLGQQVPDHLDVGLQRFGRGARHLAGLTHETVQLFEIDLVGVGPGKIETVERA